MACLFVYEIQPTPGDILPAMKHVEMVGIFVKRKFFAGQIMVLRWLWNPLRSSCELVTMYRDATDWGEGGGCSLHRGLAMRYTFRSSLLYSSNHWLIHWGWNKMTPISKMTFWNAFSWMAMLIFQLNVSLNIVLKGLIDNELALVQIMVWRWTDDKPLSEPMVV